MKPETIERLTLVINELSRVANTVNTDTNEAVATGDHIAIITHYNNLRLANAQIKEARELLGSIEKQLSTDRIPAVMGQQEIKTITIEGIGRVTVNTRYTCSMPDKDSGMDWLKANGHGGLIKPTVNSGSLSAFAKEMLIEQGKELPSELFKVSTSQHTSITKV